MILKAPITCSHKIKGHIAIHKQPQETLSTKDWFKTHTNHLLNSPTNSKINFSQSALIVQGQYINIKLEEVREAHNESKALTTFEGMVF